MREFVYDFWVVSINDHFIQRVSEISTLILTGNRTR
jgi:hypothetical protein